MEQSIQAIREPHAGGRPMRFATPEDFIKEAQAYFDNTPKEDWLITGLCLHLGTFRNVLMDYQRNDEFSNAIKWAKQTIESAYESDLRRKGNPSGAIFGLKNFGWADKQELAVSGELVTSESMGRSAVGAAYAAYLREQATIEGDVIETTVSKESDE